MRYLPFAQTAFNSLMPRTAFCRSQPMQWGHEMPSL